MDDRTFSKRLTAVLDAAGLSPSVLHERTNIAETSISKFRSGARKPKIDNLAKILPHLPKNTDIYWLITGERR